MEDLTLRAMMDDLGIGRQNDLPMAHDPRPDRIPPRRTRVPAGVPGASAGWGALATNGLDDPEAEASRALGDLGGGRLHAAAHDSMNALYNSVQRVAYERAPTQRPTARGTRTTNLGALERDGVPTKRFGNHPNVQPSLPIRGYMVAPQQNRGPPPHAAPRTVPARSTASPNPPSESIARLRVAPQQSHGPSLAAPRTGPAPARPTTNVIPTIQPQPAVPQHVAHVSTPGPVVTTLSAGGRTPVSTARVGAVWSPPRHDAPNANPATRVPASIRADAETPSAIQPSLTQAPQKCQTQDLLEDMGLDKVPEPAMVPSGLSLTILKSTCPCRIAVHSLGPTTPIAGVFSMKLAQKDDTIVGSFAFKLDNGTLMKFKWNKMVAINLNIPGNSLAVEFTFENGSAGDETYTVNVINKERMEKLKDMLHGIHEILCLNNFMSGREDEVMKAVEAAELTFRDNSGSECKVEIGSVITSHAADDMAKNLGVPANAITAKLRNIMRASFVRHVSENFQKMGKVGSPGTEGAAKESEHVDGGAIRMAETSKKALAEKPATDIAIKKETAANDSPSNLDGATPASVQKETVIDRVIKEEAESAVAVDMKETSSRSAPHERPASEVTIKKEVVDDDVCSTTVAETTSDLVRFEEPVVEVNIKKEDTDDVLDTVASPTVVEVAPIIQERTHAPHERAFSVTPVPESISAPSVISAPENVSVPATPSRVDTSVHDKAEAPSVVSTPENVSVTVNTPPRVDTSVLSKTSVPAETPIRADTSVLTNTPTHGDTSVRGNASVPDAMIPDELEEGELVDIGEGVEASFETVERGKKVTTMQLLRQGRLIRKIVTVEEYVYDDADISSEL